MYSELPRKVSFTLHCFFFSKWTTTLVTLQENKVHDKFSVELDQLPVRRVFERAGLKVTYTTCV